MSSLTLFVTPLVVLAVVAFGATLALGLSVPALWKMFAFVFGFSFVVSYLILGSGFLLSLRRFNPAPEVSLATIGLAVLLVAAGNVVFTFLFSIYTK